jgi:hypothetical protein
VVDGRRRRRSSSSLWLFFGKCFLCFLATQFLRAFGTETFS